ncbi:MAG: AraC family transcriptional regulator [Pseudodesulfovibrio sp.]|uniref:Helix-turn-helix-domain containing protein AraC type n=1 Tax=Pseudodesulfovibrio aespoeensis (strain ATCC 700646 / DSM 10631 / Aspo-2) TaxID=643562 RepID=E6VZK9_PSEA9|nr:MULTISPECIES: AraC family transcriptional regulator [Pseudodesulfovibrio]MBU4191047.1 AraC family transcriptional regulator [Pseudomonadota bacterium]ADU61723.1 helix-turn-helix- domain containing protein AraC type [Pseudodesulfovibrio aespoeensis Aspo-2]MBU4243363.1 AraC family transcriptional regulator [Pseudomonadota bacterium]MBU4380446.1 AraC family transcriptional regulator [Pseudomonadota bacterium]MBU4475994.1 AraC family transcriptional regulator [Pseudomonadota bacterium]
MGRNPANTHVRFWRDPDLPGVEIRTSRYNAEAFCRHVHDAWSVGLIEDGRTTFVLEEARHVAARGKIVVIPPGAVHACNPDPNSVMAYRMFYVAPGLLDGVAAEVFGRARSGGSPRFGTPVIDDADLYRLWRRLHAAVATGADALEKQSLLMQGLAELLTRHGRLGSPRQCGRVPDAVKTVRHHLAARLDERVSLDDLSALVGISRYHLLRVFSREAGLPPHAYQNQLRVVRAKVLLAQGEPISQVAAEVGFADQSHFTRVFRQFTGATPRQYQAGTHV